MTAPMTPERLAEIRAEMEWQLGDLGDDLLTEADRLKEARAARAATPEVTG